MAEPIFHGICENCIHARTCRYALNAARPVHFCDLYEVNEKNAENVHFEAPSRRSRPENYLAGRYRGLCVDCGKRHDCEKARIESGVWRCEEYEGPLESVPTDTNR